MFGGRVRYLKSKLPDNIVEIQYRVLFKFIGLAIDKVKANTIHVFDRHKLERSPVYL